MNYSILVKGTHPELHLNLETSLNEVIELFDSSKLPYRFNRLDSKKIESISDLFTVITEQDLDVLIQACEFSSKYGHYDEIKFKEHDATIDLIYEAQQRVNLHDRLIELKNNTDDSGDHEVVKI